MNNEYFNDQFSGLSTPLVADACIRLRVPLRIAPIGVKSLLENTQVVGYCAPIRHYGSVDIFLEGMSVSNAGDVLVIDNQGRLDEGCIGDLTVLEAKAHGLSGIFVWGAHRDTEELRKIGFPVFTYASFPAGPRRLDLRHPEALKTAQIGDFLVSQSDVFFGDMDGCVFVPSLQVGDILQIARSIWQKERQQAEALSEGVTLWEQFRFEQYLRQREIEPGYTFRQHLKTLGGAIEE